MGMTNYMSNMFVLHLGRRNEMTVWVEVSYYLTSKCESLSNFKTGHLQPIFD